jgi:sirohydrochlorin cobaltochelatase
MARTGIVLAGHGSHLRPDTAGVVWEQVDRLRARGAADEVTAAFWKEQPSFHTVLQTLAVERITVVPLFTAHGYFTRTVIPAEMGLTGALTEQDGRIIRYTAPLGAHPGIADIVRARISEAIHESGADSSRIAVAVIGHSTRRDPESRRATERQAEQVRAAGIAAEVAAVYLDDTPAIPDVYTLTRAPVLIAVPYFLALGSHVTIDVPAALGLPDGVTRAQIDGRDVIYTPPMGTDARLTDMIIDLIASADPVALNASHSWAGFPALIDTLHQTDDALIFGELRLTRDCVHVDGDPAPHEPICDPMTLRARVRTPTADDFRPLTAAHDLPRGWHVPITTPEMLHAVIETIYPGAIAAWAAARAGTLHINRLDATIARQTGQYRGLAALSDAARTECVQRLCGACAYVPLWYADHSPLNSNAIPCSDACNVWLSATLPLQNEESS